MSKNIKIPSFPSLDEKVNLIDEFYQLGSNENEKYNFSPPLQLLKENFNNVDNVNLPINDFSKKVSYYYLWEKLAVLYIERTTTTEKIEKKKILLNEMIECDLKTSIIHIFFQSRPSISKVNNNLKNLNEDNKNIVNSLDKTLYQKYDKEHTLKTELITQIRKNMEHAFKSPYIQGHHDFNDNIHELMIKLIPLLPTIFFILFPLDYLPIFAFSLTFQSLLRSNHFTGWASHWNTKSGSNSDNKVVNTSIFNNESYHFHMKQSISSYLDGDDNDDDIKDDYNPNVVFNIEKFVKQTRRRLYLSKLTIESQKQHFQKEYQPSYLPFIIYDSLGYYKESNSSSSSSPTKNGIIKFIDVFYQRNYQYDYFQKLSSQNEPKFIKINLVKEETGRNHIPLIIENVYYGKPIENEKEEEDEQNTSNLVWERIHFDTNSSLQNNDENYNRLIKQTILSHHLSMKRWEKKEKQFNNDKENHWKGNITSPDFINTFKLPNLNKHYEMNVKDDLNENGDDVNTVYNLFFSYEHSKNDKDRLNSLLFEEGYYTKIDFNTRDQFDDKPKHIAIYDERSSNKSNWNETISQKTDLEKRELEENSAIIQKSGTPPIQKIISIEETIGIIDNWNFKDNQTTIQLELFSRKKNVIKIHSPILYSLHKEYSKCVKSLLKPVLGKPYDVFGDDGLRILFVGKASEDRPILLSIIPLIDFIKPTMTINTFSVNGSKLQNVFDTKNIIKKTDYNDYINIMPIFNETDKKISYEHYSYNTILLNKAFDSSTQTTDNLTNIPKDKNNTTINNVRTKSRSKSLGKNLKKPVEKKQQFGRFHEVFFAPKFDKNGFDLMLFNKETSATIKDIKVVVLRNITVESFDYNSSHSTITIQPSNKRNIRFTLNKLSTMIQLHQELQIGGTVEIEFLINDTRSEIYKTNGMIDRFTLTFNNLLYRVNAIEIIHDNERDYINYTDNENGDDEVKIMRIHTTDNKLSKEKNHFVYSIDSINLYLVDNIIQ